LQAAGFSASFASSAFLIEFLRDFGSGCEANIAMVTLMALARLSFVVFDHLIEETLV
jgi:hypothetical protein